MKKLFKLILKGILGLILILGIAFVVLKVIYSDELPKGTSGEKADALAQNMLNALNYDQFKTAKEIHWTFRGKNTYKWDMQRHVVDVFWDDYQVTYTTKDRQTSKAYLNGESLEGDAKTKAITYAVDNFNNDSFWVVAPFKVFDGGTTRSIVEEEGKQKLLVRFSSGGTTPGDAYLWELDQQFRPVAFKMWVSILPFDGLEAQWSDWQKTRGGFLLPHQKTVFGLEIPITNLEVIP